MQMNKEIVLVRLSDIIPNRFQPRLTFDEEALEELSNSIKEHGIIQPLILRDLGNKYEIIAGERRYKASTMAGLTEVPAIIGEMDDQTSAELALIENIQRKDLTAIEEAKSYKKILDMGNFTQEELAKKMGKSQSTIANKMRLLSLTNEVQVSLMNNLISERHARCLLQVKDENIQREVLNKIISERMNVKDTEEYIKSVVGVSSLPEKQEMIPSEPQFNQKEEIISPLVEPDDKPPVQPLFANEPIHENAPEKETIIPSESVVENPNVYTQSDNIDFVNINSLNSSNPVNSEPVKSALDNLNLINTASDNFNDQKTLIEDKEVIPMQRENIDNIAVSPLQGNIVKSDSNDFSKIKLSTAIRLAKDTVEDIKTAGYTVTLEEINNQNDYEIVIKIQK